MKCGECGQEFPYNDYLPVGDFHTLPGGEVWYYCEECLKKKIISGEIPKSEQKVLGIIRWDGVLLYFMPDGVTFIECKGREKEFLEWGLTEEEMRKYSFDIPYSEITRARIGLKKRRFSRARFVEIEMVTTKKSYKGAARGLLFSIEGHYAIEKKKPKIENYEKLLQPIFRDKLSVEK